MCGFDSGLVDAGLSAGAYLQNLDAHILAGREDGTDERRDGPSLDAGPFEGRRTIAGDVQAYGSCLGGRVSRYLMRNLDGLAFQVPIEVRQFFEICREGMADPFTACGFTCRDFSR